MARSKSRYEKQRRLLFISLLATLFVGVLFALMVNDTRALAMGSDPMTDHVHELAWRFPRATFALGMVLGHLFWA